MLLKLKNRLNKITTINYLLRKTKSFNKSRYSRNRQYYRTGVYMCLWFNIIFVLGGYYFMFRLTLKFSYVTPLIIIFINIILFSYFSRNMFYGFCSSIFRFFNLVSFYLLNTILSLFYLVNINFKLKPFFYIIKPLNSIYLNLYKFWIS